MYRRWLLFILCILLVVGGASTTAWAVHRRAVELRGYVDPTQNADLPLKLPLPGVNVELTQYGDTTLNHELDRIASAGFVWVRQMFPWPDIEATQGQLDFSRYDRLVSAVNAHPPLKLVAVLGGTPVWARRADTSDRLWSPPNSMAAFAEFAGQFASHYASQIDYYQVWDEPNLYTSWGGIDPQPADYAAMLRASYKAIHANDSTATVIMAALAPTTETGPRNISDVVYLRALYDVGAKDAFDAAAGKPYGFDSSPTDRTTSQDVLNFSHLILLREEMVKHGDGTKALWGSNFGWNHLPDGWSGPPSIWGQVDATTQQQYIKMAYDRASQEWPWMGGLILEHWQPAAAADDPIQGFAVSSMSSIASLLPAPSSTLSAGLYDPTDPRIQYQGDWRFDPGHGVDINLPSSGDVPEDGSANKLTFKFAGTALAFNLRRQQDPAYMYVNVDGQPANALPHMSTPSGSDAYIMLKSPDLAPHLDLILAAQNLVSGEHNAELRQYLGYGQWALAGIAVGGAVDTSRFTWPIAAGIALMAFGVIGLIVVSRQLRWWSVVSPANVQPLWAYFRRVGDILAGIAISFLAMLGMFLTWGNTLPNVFRRDAPTLALTILTVGLIYFSPSFLITLAALIALWLIIYHRPLVGFALVIFWSPFFGVPVELYLRQAPLVEVCLLLTLTAVVVRAIVNWQTSLPALKRFRWSAVRLADWAMIAMIIVAGISLAWSEQRGPAARELLVIIIQPAILYFMLRLSTLTRDDLKHLVDALLAAGTVVALIGIIQLFVGGTGVILTDDTQRIASVYGSPNNLALFLGRCIPFAIALFLLAPGTWRRAVTAIMALIMGIAVVLTQSAGALLLGIPASVIIILFFWNPRRGLIFSGGLAAAFLALIPLSRYIPRLQKVFDLTRSSSLTRTYVWTSAINLLREHPLTGAGLDQFLYLYRSRYILPEGWREPDLSHPHNLFLDYWVSLGIAGLGILIALQLAFWRTALSAWRRWRGTDVLMAALALGAMGSMVDFLVHGLVDNSYFVVDLAYVFCLTLALVGKLRELPTAQAG